MKKITVWLLTLAFAATMLAGCGSKTDTTDTTETTEATSAADETSDGAADTADTSEDGELLTGLHHVTIDVQDYGTISLELDADTAPISVTNFINLANEGFYDGLTFHRIISGFMIQGGGFKPGMDEVGTREPIKNEANNGLSNEKYTIAMARTNDPHSASAQFFINVADNKFLDFKSETMQGWGHRHCL